MLLKQLIIALLLVSQLLPFQVRANESQSHKLRAGPVYKNNDNSYGVVIELPLIIEVSSLTTDNTKLSIGKGIGASQIKSFKNSGEKLAWLLCIDVSGSMAGAPLDEVKRSLRSLFGDRRSLQIGLMSFGNKSDVVFEIDNTGEAGLLTKAVEQLKDHGSKSQTKLYQALYEALDYFEDTSKTVDLPLRKRILVISDGKDEGSSVSSKNVIDRSLGLGIPIDAVGRGKIEPQYIESLKLLAESTGGYFIHASPDYLSLTDALKRMHGMLMERQTAVAYFEYKADEIAPTSSAKVAVDLPASKLVSDYLDVKFPTPIPSDSSPPHLSWQWWWIAGVLIIMGVFLIIFWQRAKETKGNISARDNGEFSRQSSINPEENFKENQQTSFHAKGEGQSYSTQKSTQVVSPNMRRETVIGAVFSSPQHNKPSAFLIGIDGAVKNQKIGVDKEMFFIGAGIDNDFSIPDDSYISSKHACIRYEKGSFYILDQKSSNGTFVNGERLGSSACLLIPGCRIKLGDSIFEFHKIAN